MTEDATSEATQPYSPEIRLVEQLVSGDPTSWEKLVQGHARIVRSSIRLTLNGYGQATDGTLTDDLTAEVFSALLSNDCACLRAYQGRSSLATYLRVIAVRVTIRHLRQIDGRRNSPISADLEDYRGPSPEQRAITNEQKQQLEHLIEQLPQRQREIISLYYFHGLTYHQISQRLNMPMGSIGPTLQRAEQRLRECLENPSSSSARNRE